MQVKSSDKKDLVLRSVIAAAIILTLLIVATPKPDGAVIYPGGGGSGGGVTSTNVEELMVGTLWATNMNVNRYQLRTNAATSFNIDFTNGVWVVSTNNSFLFGGIINYNPTNDNFTRYMVTNSAGPASPITVSWDTSIRTVGSTNKSISVTNVGILSFEYLRGFTNVAAAYAH